MAFTRAVRRQAKLRCGLDGPSSSGKTTGALLIARGLVGPKGRIAVIDTERGSASLYSDLTEFDTQELNPPFSPERFIEALHDAEQSKYDVVIIDSVTHEWDGSGGCLEINETLARAKFKGNTWSAWSETTPRHRAFIDAMLQSPIHVIGTMRSKTETVQEGGRVKKVGMKSVQREGTEYEFTLVFSLEHESHLAVASKNRTPMFKGDPFLITTRTGEEIRAWLDSGAHEEPPPKSRAAAVCMDVKEVSEREREILLSGDIETLRENFTSAKEAALRLSDRLALERFTQAKDKRKAELMNSPAPQPAEKVEVLDA
jgi:hypothetical protein